MVQNTFPEKRARMKSDRLYGITLHLLNHGKTSAAYLAKKFEVSVRTIQRDMDALCMAGVPVVSETGAAGGYYLAEKFRMDAQTATQEDYSHMLTALKGYSTALKNPQVAALMEKVGALTQADDSGIVLDFSVLREVDDRLMQTLKTAISRKQAVRFGYTNAENISREHTVEPVAVVYQWYAWYLLAYSRERQDYRLYKLVRMTGAEVTEQEFTRTHAPAETIMRENRERAPQPVTEIRVRCRPAARAKAIEYLNGTVTAEYPDGGCDMTLRVIESEHLWFGTLLALGDGAEVIAPEHIRRRLIQAAEEIVRLYAEV